MIGWPRAEPAHRPWRRDAVTMAAIVVVGCVATISFGERIGVNRGQGWDGMSYVAWAEAFWRRVVEDGLTRYHAQRVLPSAIVHYGLRGARATPDLAHVIAGFQVLNTVVLAGAAVLWAELGAVMQWRRASVWVGFVALFGGFANARHALYYPTLTDPAAFALGMALVWGYLTRRTWVLWLVAAAGLVTWPALPPLAIALMVLPRRASVVEDVVSLRTRRVIAAVLAAAGATVFLLIAWRYLVHPVPGVGDEKFAQWVRRDLLVVTVPALAVMLGAGWYVLLRAPRLWDVRGELRALSVKRTMAVVVAIGALIAMRQLWLARVGTHGEGPSGAQFLCEHTLAALRGPLWGLVHQVVYFGPIVIVAVLHWRRIAERAAAWGPGAVLALALVVAFAAGSNARQWNHLLPFLVAATIAATDARWTARRALGFLVIALGWSKLWLKIGYDRQLAWQEFPNQRYFMNLGPYANDAMYVVHLAASVVTAILLVFLLREITDPARRDHHP